MPIESKLAKTDEKKQQQCSSNLAAECDGWWTQDTGWGPSCLDASFKTKI